MKESSSLFQAGKALGKQFSKFAVVGVIAFFIDYGCLVFFTEVFHINYLVSATLSFTISVIFNYLASMRYVFRHKENCSTQKEFVVFVVLSVIGLLLNNLLLWVGQSVLYIDYRISKIFVTGIVMVYNFVSRKIFLEG